MVFSRPRSKERSDLHVAEPPQQSIDPSFPVAFSAEIKGRSFTDDLRLDLGGATRKFAREVDLCVREIEVVRYRRCPPIPPDWTRHDVFRYLRARKGDLEKAVLMIEQHLVWKKSFSEPVPAGSPLLERPPYPVTSEQKLIGIGKMNAAIREERERVDNNINIPVEIVCDEGKRVVAADLEASLRDAYMQGWAGVDNDGRPIYVEQLGKIDKAKVAQLFDVEKLEWMLYLQQEHTRKLKYLAVSERVKKPIYLQNTVLLDLKGGALRLANSKVCRDMVKLLARVNADNYPESCARILIVGAPFGFETAWAVLKRFLDPVVAEKVIIRKRVEDVFQFADRSQLPAFLGGELSDDQIADDFHPNHPWMKSEFLEKLAKKNCDLAKCWEEVLAEIEGGRDRIQRGGPRAGGQGPLHPGETEADASRPAGMKEAGGLAASKSTSSSSTTILGPKSSSGASATTSTTKGSGGSTTMLGSLATCSSTAASTSSTAEMPGPGKSGEIATEEVVVALPSGPRDLNLRQPQESKCAGGAAVSGFLDPAEDGEVTPETAASTQQSGEDVDEEVVGSHAGGRFSPTSAAAHPRIEGDEEAVAPPGEAGSKLWLCMLKPFELCRSKRRIRNS